MVDTTSMGLESALRVRMVGVENNGVRVEDVELRSGEDADGQSAWRVTLFLTKPKNRSGWDVDTTRALKRQARLEVDDLTAAAGPALEGATSVDVSTRDAPPSDIAEPEAPVEGESADLGSEGQAG
ncbi:hypothetical protein HQQ81_08140 [Microbacteriaceae bacterium VKM Ac-2854]|nr:hypothetical protein [Microbacteriaceae bacterium VKM Ac-2854]